MPGQICFAPVFYYEEILPLFTIDFVLFLLFAVGNAFAEQHYWFDYR